MTATLTPTAERGATAQPHEQLYVPTLDHARPEEHAALLEGTGLNGSFLVDTLSAMCAHERCGHHLYRSVTRRTVNPVLSSRYERFGEETLEHVEILEGLLRTLGANPLYVSPTARAVEVMDTKVLESTFLAAGPLDVVQREMAMLDAVILAETIDHASWSTLQDLVGSVPEGELRSALADAVARVEGEEDRHLAWALQTKKTMVLLQATNPTMAAMGIKAEQLAETVKGWFAD